MTEGVSKERLIEIKQSLPYGQARLNLDRLIKAECKELDPCLLVDENTPRDRRLNLYWEKYGWFTGQWRCNQFMCDAGLSVPVNISPRYYRELPKNPISEE